MIWLTTDETALPAPAPTEETAPCTSDSTDDATPGISVISVGIEGDPVGPGSISVTWWINDETALPAPAPIEETAPYTSDRTEDDTPEMFVSSEGMAGALVGPGNTSVIWLTREESALPAPSPIEETAPCTPDRTEDTGGLMISEGILGGLVGTGTSSVT